MVLAGGILGGYRLAAARREGVPFEWAAPSTGRLVRAGGLRLFVTEAGPASGPPVLLVHGTGAWGEIWRPTLDALAARGYHAVAVDVPPFGFSERPAGGDYRTPAQAARIAALMDALDLRGAILVGHSFGARATVEAALLRRERVQRLVLVDPALTLEPPRPPGRATRAVLAVPPLRDALVAATATNPRMTRWLIRGLISRKQAATEERVAMLRRPMRVRGSTAALGRYLAVFMTDTTVTASGRPETYRTLPFPTLLIWGEADTLTPLADGRRLHRLIPGSRLVVLPGVGHIPPLEAPGDLNRALLEGIH